MTTLYEPVCHGPEHAPFNAALIATVIEAFPGQAVTFCGEASHVAAVRWILSDAGAGVRWMPIVIAPRVCESTRVRFGYEWRTVARVLDEVHRAGSTLLIACACTTPGLAALKLQLAFSRRRERAVVIHHSAIASMIASRSTRALIAYGNGDRIRHVVLGETIRRAIAERCPELERCVFSMRHPYLFPAATPSTRLLTDGVRFGFLGLASQDKGFDAFCRLAARVTGERRNGNDTHFELVGRLAAEYRDALPEGGSEVDIVERGAPLPRETYEQRVDALTYAVLPYARAHYALTSSGAILDAFVHIKPCIVLRNPLFEEYFAAMGDIGYLCSNEEEMFDVVRAIGVHMPTERYADQCRNIFRGRRIFSPPRVAEELRSIVGR